MIVPGEPNPNLEHASQLVFVESVSPSTSNQTVKAQPETTHSFENIRISYDHDRVNIHSNFSRPRFSEIPMAENHKIGELLPGEALRFMAKDRSDFSMKARKQSKYIFYDYLVHYLGQAKRIIYTDKVKAAPVSITSWKEVDERKIIQWPDGQFKLN